MVLDCDKYTGNKSIFLSVVMRPYSVVVVAVAVVVVVGVTIFVVVVCLSYEISPWITKTRSNICS